MKAKPKIYVLNGRWYWSPNGCSDGHDVNGMNCRALMWCIRQNIKEGR